MCVCQVYLIPLTMIALKSGSVQSQLSVPIYRKFGRRRHSQAFTAFFSQSIFTEIENWKTPLMRTFPSDLAHIKRVPNTHASLASVNLVTLQTKSCFFFFFFPFFSFFFFSGKRKTFDKVLYLLHHGIRDHHFIHKLTQLTPDSLKRGKEWNEIK